MSIARKRVCHHFTVDVEEYFQVLALEPYIPRAQWDVLPRRLDVGLRSLLDILSEHDALATFFVLGWIADRHPELVRDISARGHEVASHGSDHRLVTTLTKMEFRESVRTSKSSLENIIGRPIVGYRAPNFSIGRGDEWAFEILFEEGYRYDSSIFPGRRGNRFVRSERDPYCMRLAAGTLHEIPVGDAQDRQHRATGGRGCLFSPSALPGLFIPHCAPPSGVECRERFTSTHGNSIPSNHESEHRFSLRCGTMAASHGRLPDWSVFYRLSAFSQSAPRSAWTILSHRSGDIADCRRRSEPGEMGSFRGIGPTKHLLSSVQVEGDHA